MTKLNEFSTYIKLTSLLFLFSSFFGITLPNLLESVPAERPEEVITDFQNITMCAPISRFKIDMHDILTSTKPLAPKLNPKWTTQLQIASSSKEAKEFFSQGLFYLYAFNHAEADRSFKEAIRLDPACAMCYWGVALALGPNINMPMPEANNEDAYNYSQKALQLSANTSEIEQALILVIGQTT